MLVLFVAESNRNSAVASVTEFTSEAAWQAVVDRYTTITFTPYPSGTLLTDQYASLGVAFTDGVDFVYYNTNIFVLDGAGARGSINDTMTLEFSAPTHWISVNHPGFIQFELYWQGVLTYTSTYFTTPGVGHFHGLVSQVPFDEARLFDVSGGVVIDDLHFGAPIPAPGALALLAIAALASCSRRRKPS